MSYFQFRMFKTSWAFYVSWSGASFTNQQGLSSFLSEKFTLIISYHKILSLNLRYFMKLAPDWYIWIQNWEGNLRCNSQTGKYIHNHTTTKLRNAKLRSM